jgi:hypothetical protein
MTRPIGKISKLPVAQDQEETNSNTKKKDTTTVHMAFNDYKESRKRIPSRVCTRRPAAEEVLDIVNKINEEPRKKRPRMTPWHRLESMRQPF